MFVYSDLNPKQQEYVLFCSIQSTETAAGITCLLRAWNAYLGGRPEMAATLNEARGFIASKAGRWGAGTAYRSVGMMRSYWKWLDCEVNPWLKVRLRPQRRRIPRVLDKEEWDRLESAMGTLPEEPRAHRRGLRRWAMLRVAFAAGLRNAEVRRLAMDDLDMERRLVVVRGKGDKERSVPFGPRTAALLQAWLDEARPWYHKARTVGPLFPSERGHHLSNNVLHRDMQTVLAQAGISRRIYPHLLRHSYATMLLEGGMNVRELQALMGHEHLSSTEIYLHVRAVGLRDSYDRAFAGLG